MKKNFSGGPGHSVFAKYREVKFAYCAFCGAYADMDRHICPPVPPVWKVVLKDLYPDPDEPPPPDDATSVRAWSPRNAALRFVKECLDNGGTDQEEWSVLVLSPGGCWVEHIVEVNVTVHYWGRLAREKEEEKC